MNAIAKIRETLASPDLHDQLKVLLPQGITVEKFVSVAMTAVVRNDDLIEADRTSLLLACADCARDGLLPDGKQAALVVHSTKKKVLQADGSRKEVWVKAVTYMPMVRGLYMLANGSGDVARLAAHLVYAEDSFGYELGTDPSCSHVPATGDRGVVTHVYAVAKFKDGSLDLEVMTRLEVEAVRAMSKQPDGLMWTKAWGEGAKKTVVHRICKRLELTPEVHAAVDRIEGGFDLDKLPPPRPTAESLGVYEGPPEPAVEAEPSQEEVQNDRT